MFYVCFVRAAKTVKRHKYLSNGAAISTPFQWDFGLSAKITKSALKSIKKRQQICMFSIIRPREVVKMTSKRYQIPLEGSQK